MNTIPFVHEGLGNSSYIIDLGNQMAVVVDPDRNVERYFDVLDARKLKLTAVFETHLHADFVSGAKELAARTSSPIFLAGDAAAKFPHEAVHGGQTIALEGCEVAALDSPGHTPEHLSWVFKTASAPPALLSGGSLIVGGAARTDLISASMTESLTRAQFRTLHQAFSELPDETLLYPTHGGGSFCSTGAGGERVSTLGQERRTNPVLSVEDEGEFARWFPSTFPAVPDYFFRLRAVNQKGPALRHDILQPLPLDPSEFAQLQSDCVVVDVRSKEAYAEGHIAGSLSNAYRDVFAIWLGWLVPADARLLFVTDETPVEDIVDESLLVGYERFAGWLKGGVGSWQASGHDLERIQLVDAARARRFLADGAASLDIREPNEYQAGHIEAAIHLPLGRLGNNLNLVPRDRPIVVYCGHGERASTAASLLEAAGFRDLVNLDGGIGSWRDSGFNLVQ